MKNEPVLTIIAGLANVVQVALGALSAWGFNLSAQQTAAVMAFTTVIVNVLLAIFARQQVTPTSTLGLGQGQ